MKTKFSELADYIILPVLNLVVQSSEFRFYKVNCTFEYKSLDFTLSIILQQYFDTNDIKIYTTLKSFGFSRSLKI